MQQHHIHTDIQYQSFSRGVGCIDTKWPHASDDWTDEVDVEDGEEVDDVEDDGEGEEAHAPKTRHGCRKKRSVVGMQMRTTSSVGLGDLEAVLKVFPQLCPPAWH